MVVDSAYLERYSVGGTPAGQVPAWATSAETIVDLATACEIDPDGLAATVEEFNLNAAEGRDQLFARGESVADRYLGDARQPHPCLAPLTRRAHSRRTFRCPCTP